MVPVTLLIVTIFRKAKKKNRGIAPVAPHTAKKYVTKNQFWRRVVTDANGIELEEKSEAQVKRRESASTIDVESESSPPYDEEIKKRPCIK